MALHIAVKVAYYNTKDFAHGFQIQPNVETIFNLLLRALQKSAFLEKENGNFTYAGRTDHAVNAISQIISFNLNEMNNVIPDRFLHRINANLPDNIRCWAYSIVSETFHPRYLAQERHYCYIYTPHFSEKLNMDLMKKSAEILTGTHNFLNFAKKKSELENYVRTIRKISIEENNGALIFNLRAKSFLWQQCRRITAHLIQIGKNEVDMTETVKLLTKFEHVKKPTPLPPENLILTDIIYEDVHFIEDRSIKLKILQSINEDLHHLQIKENSLNFILKFLDH